MGGLSENLKASSVVQKGGIKAHEICQFHEIRGGVKESGMKGLKQSPLHGRLNVFGLLVVGLVALTATLVLGAFLGQSSTVYAADTESVVMDRSSPADMAASETGFGLGAWTVDITYDSSVVEVVDCTVPCSSIGSNTIRVTGHADADGHVITDALTVPDTTLGQQGSIDIQPAVVVSDNGILSPDSAIVIDGQTVTTRSSAVTPTTSIGQDLIAFSIIGAILVVITSTATVTIIRRRLQRSSSSATSMLPSTSKMVTVTTRRGKMAARQGRVALKPSLMEATPPVDPSSHIRIQGRVTQASSPNEKALSAV